MHLLGLGDLLIEMKCIQELEAECGEHKEDDSCHLEIINDRVDDAPKGPNCRQLLLFFSEDFVGKYVAEEVLRLLIDRLGRRQNEDVDDEHAHKSCCLVVPPVSGYLFNERNVQLDELLVLHLGFDVLNLAKDSSHPQIRPILLNFDIKVVHLHLKDTCLADVRDAPTVNRRQKLLLFLATVCQRYLYRVIICQEKPVGALEFELFEDVGRLLENLFAEATSELPDVVAGALDL